jgi:hypothetical protein
MVKKQTGKYAVFNSMMKGSVARTLTSRLCHIWHKLL